MQTVGSISAQPDRICRWTQSVHNPMEWVIHWCLAPSRYPKTDGDLYENLDHHDPSNDGPNQYKGSKSVLPKNHRSYVLKVN
ncbi:hypothetical protein CRV00_06310 [Malaciobacter molluscorum]|nr:hypothetical protein CRV00_06310 [Malaciobacter molluscorum]